MKKILISLVNFYQKFLSRETGILWVTNKKTCNFYPTCSEYTKICIEKNGTKGIFMGIKRISRCHPWSGFKIDNPL